MYDSSTELKDSVVSERGASFEATVLLVADFSNSHIHFLQIERVSVFHLGNIPSISDDKWLQHVSTSHLSPYPCPNLVLHQQESLQQLDINLSYSRIGTRRQSLILARGQISVNSI